MLQFYPHSYRLFGRNIYLFEQERFFQHTQCAGYHDPVRWLSLPGALAIIAVAFERLLDTFIVGAVLQYRL